MPADKEVNPKVEAGVGKVLKTGSPTKIGPKPGPYANPGRMGNHSSYCPTCGKSVTNMVDHAFSGHK